MTTDLDRVLARLDELSRRMERVEAVLGAEIYSIDVAPPTQPATPVVSTPIVPTTPLPMPSAGPAPIVYVTAPKEEPPEWTEPVKLWSEIESPEPPTPEEVAKEKRAFDFEHLVGSRWLAWVGALIVVAGIGLFVKYAYDQGWIRIPPAGRCIAGAVFGIALLGAGEILRRKVNAIAAVGVLAAGIGSIYASALASHELYHLVPPSVALVMLGVTSLIGVATAIRSRLVSVGAVSLVGGYIAPVLVTGQTLSPVVLPAYLLFLLATGVILAGWRGGKFGWLRFLTWMGTIVLGSVWMGATGLKHPSSSIPFLLLAWALVHAELCWSAFRGFAASEGTIPQSINDWVGLGANWQQWRPLISSFGLTGWATGLAILLAKQNQPDLDWLAPAVGAVATAVCLGLLLLGGRVRGMSTDAKHLAFSLAAQTGGLVLLAIGMALTGWVMAMGWLALGLASGCTAVVVRSRPLLVYGVVALVAGSGRLLAYDWAYSGMNSGGYEWLGLQLTTWTGMMLVAAVCWAVVGVLVGNRGDASLQPVATACIGVAAMLAPTAFVHPDAAAGAMSAVMLISGVVCAALNRGRQSVLFLVATPVLLGVGMAMAFGTKWWVSGSATWVGIEGLPIRARAMSAVFAGGALLAAGRALRRGEAELEVRGILGILGAMMFYAAIVNEKSSASALSWAFLVLSIGIAGIATVFGSTRYLATAVGGLLGATVAWGLAYLLPGWSLLRAPPLLHPGLWGALVISGAALGMARGLAARLKDEQRVSFIESSSAAVFVLLLTATSLEVGRVAGRLSHDVAARGGAISIWWAIVACGLIVGGFAKRVPLIRHAGLAFLFFAGAKVVAYDLRDVGPEWRIASFLSVGVLMLLVAVGYARLTSMLAKPGAATT